jgi:hypothetical protein
MPYYLSAYINMSCLPSVGPRFCHDLLRPRLRHAGHFVVTPPKEAKNVHLHSHHRESADGTDELMT